MGVYIKSMEMPDTCCHCPLMGYDPEIEWNDGGRETQGAYICVMTHELIDNTKREDHCPLVPVPPHGDLIDRDALIVELMDRGVEGLQTDDWHEIQQAVADAHAIIPAEEGET